MDYENLVVQEFNNFGNSNQASHQSLCIFSPIVLAKHFFQAQGVKGLLMIIFYQSHSLKRAIGYRFCHITQLSFVKDSFARCSRHFMYVLLNRFTSCNDNVFSTSAINRRFLFEGFLILKYLVAVTLLFLSQNNN